VLRGLVSFVPLGLTTIMLVFPAFGQDLGKSENLYKHTDYEASLASLDLHSSDPAFQFLIARDYFMLGDFKKSVDYLLKATAEKPNNAEYWDWLGRAYGRKAETSNLLAAPGYASKARAAFEQSVELDPSNRDALSDLFDYYLEAPGFLGGGYDKAQGLAEKTSKVDPAEAYFQRAKLEQKRKEYESAEIHFRKAVEVAPREIGHLLSLARFLATQGRTRESDAVFLQAQQIAPNEPKLWFVRADVLIQGKRNLSEARNLLQRYVNAPVTVDDPPKTDAIRLLKQVGGA
jgi:tetratricopeptide (TPR) repeat protein